MKKPASPLVTSGIALAVCYAVYKFVPHQAAKAASLGVAGVIVARQLPFTGPALA